MRMRSVWVSRRLVQQRLNRQPDRAASMALGGCVKPPRLGKVVLRRKLERFVGARLPSAMCQRRVGGTRCGQHKSGLRACLCAERHPRSLVPLAQVAARSCRKLPRILFLLGWRRWRKRWHHHHHLLLLGRCRRLRLECRLGLDFLGRRRRWLWLRLNWWWSKRKLLRPDRRVHLRMPCAVEIEAEELGTAHAVAPRSGNDRSIDDVSDPRLIDTGSMCGWGVWLLASEKQMRRSALLLLTQTPRFGAYSK